MKIPVETTVTSVVVYPDRARVTCVGRADLTEGLHQITVGELALAMESDYVSAAGEGTARARLGSVEV